MVHDPQFGNAALIDAFVECDMQFPQSLSEHDFATYCCSIFFEVIYTPVLGTKRFAITKQVKFRAVTNNSEISLENKVNEIHEMAYGDDLAQVQTKRINV